VVSGAKENQDGDMVMMGDWIDLHASLPMHRNKSYLDHVHSLFLCNTEPMKRVLCYIICFVSSVGNQSSVEQLVTGFL